MSGPSSLRVGGFACILSSVSNMSREELEQIKHAIGQAVLARREHRVSRSGSQQSDPVSLEIDPSSCQCQSAKPGKDVLDDFEAINAKLKESNCVVLDKDDTLIDSEEAEDEDKEMVSMDTRISNLEKNQADIMTLLRSLNEQLNPVLESPLESV